MTFRPRIIDTFLQGYSVKSLTRDITSGLIVGIVAIPLAVAFAIASGVRPDIGLLTAVLGGLVVALLGGSDVQVSGPTGAFIVIIYGVLQKYGADGLAISTIMAGLMLVGLGFGRLGSVIQYIPFPVLVGFTSGIAVIIMSSQINDFLGLGLSGIPADFIEKWQLYLSSLANVNLIALAISLITIVAIVVLRAINPRIPGALLALVVATLVVQFFALPVETIGSRFGEISGAIPAPMVPQFDLNRIRELLMPAISIALLAGIESLLSAVVADAQTGQKHDSNTELIGQGFGNIVSALFGGLPVTGAIARTATNIRSGGRSPVAAVVHAVFLLLVLLFLSPLAALVPLATLAGILATVAYNMSEHETFRMLLRGPRSDILVLLATFLLTVLIDLTIAIPVGILLALFGFIRKMSAASHVVVQTGSFSEVPEEMDPFGLGRFEIPPGVEIIDIDGPLFFGAAERLKEELAFRKEAPRVRIIRMSLVSAIDTSGIKVLRDLLAAAKVRNTTLLFVGVSPSVMKVFDRIGLTNELGLECLLPNILSAIAKARSLCGDAELSLVQKLRAGGVVEGVQATSSFELIRASVAHLPLSGHLRPQALTSMLERESLASTSLGHGLAFPHPRNPLLDNTLDESITIVYPAQPVTYDTSDGQAVYAAFFILSSASSSHLQTFAALSRLAGNQEFRDLLLKKGNVEELVAFIEKSSL